MTTGKKLATIAKPTMTLRFMICETIESLSFKFLALALCVPMHKSARFDLETNAFDKVEIGGGASVAMRCPREAWERAKGNRFSAGQRNFSKPRR